jgi:hypothetical protein
MTRFITSFSRRLRLFAGLIAVLAGLGAVEPAAQGYAPNEEVATYINKRYGFTISYPTARFKPQEPLKDEGRVWISHDGNAKLLAGALENADGMSLTEYRAFLLQES